MSNKLIKNIKDKSKGTSFSSNIFGSNMNLSYQNIDDKDIPELLQFLLEHPSIKTLDLSLNNIGDKGVADFVERNQTINYVNFSGNNIGDTGLAIFAYKNQVVTKVNFSLNPISEKGIYQFAQINEVCYTSQFSKNQLH